MWSILSNHSALAERPQHIAGTVEIGHFDVGRANALRVVRIGADARSNIELLREVDRGEVMHRVRDFGVEHLDDVQLTRRDKSLEDRLAESGALGIERVRRVHQATLGFDAVDHLRNREDVRNPLRQEEADNLPRRSADLFSNDHPDSQLTLKRLCRVNRVVVGDADDVEVDRFDAFGHLFQRRAGIARGGRVQVAVKSDPPGTRRWWWPNGIWRKQR